jgi:hypothetical protein
LRDDFAHEIRTGRLVLAHQEKEWTSRAIAEQDLNWFSERVKRQNLCLLWDCFSPHRDEVVKSEARRADIALEFIPAGLTDGWQPLDLRICGSLKMRARALFDEQWFRDDSTELTVTTAIALLLRSWDSISQEEILDSWNKIIPLW